MQINNKQISSIYRKILYKHKLAPLNIAYTSSNIWYDNTLLNFQDSFLTFIRYDTQLIDKHLYFINDPLSFSHTNEKFIPHVPKVLFFHNTIPLSMKKEDIYLLNMKIKNYKKYSFVPILKNIIPDIEILNYGFESIDDQVLNQKRNKSVLFVAEEQNLDQIIFANIKQKYPDSDIISITSSDTSNINDLLLEYKICINLNSGYNTLLAAARGCLTISNFAEPRIPHHYTIKHSGEIISSIDYILNNSNINYYINNHKILTQIYPYDKFLISINNIVNTQINTERLYE